MGLVLFIAGVIGVAVVAARRAEAALALDEASVAGAAPTTATTPPAGEIPPALEAIGGAVTGYALGEAGAEPEEVLGAAVLAGLVTGGIAAPIALVVGAIVSSVEEEDEGIHADLSEVLVVLEAEGQVTSEETAAVEDWMEAMEQKYKFW